MTKRIIVAALAVVAAAAGPPSGHRALSAQAPATDRMAIVTSDGSLHLQVWRAGGGGYEKVWEATPRTVDPPTWDKRRAEAVASARDIFEIADIDGDGSNELVAGDQYGLTVYGRSPAYYSFPSAEAGPPSFAIGDVNGDGKVELVTQRTVSQPAVSGSPEREIEVLTFGPRGLTSIWKKRFAGGGGSLLVDDVDNDREKEIVAVGGDGINILKRRPGPIWEAVAELPTSDSLVRCLDVDGDGKKEIVTGGRSGKVTVYKARKSGQRFVYPLLWQSANLMPDGMKAMSSGSGPYCFITSVAAADVDGDKQTEMIVGTQEMGRIDPKDIRGGRLHVLRFDGSRGDFASIWVSDWISPVAGVAGVADLDGDGANEIVVNGRDVYKRDNGAKNFRSVAQLLPSGSFGFVGPLPDLREPVSATRIVPLYFSLPNRQVAEGDSAEATLTLRNVWSEAKDVSLTVTPQDSGVQVTGASFKFPSIPANGTVTTPAFKVTGRESGKLVYLKFDVTAAGGFQQSSTAYVIVSSPMPTYLPDVDRRVMAALARARDDNKRVLIQWGSNADPAASSLIAAMRKDGTVSNTLLYEYEIVRADPKGGERVASKYKGAGARPAPPYFTVLDAQGKLLASQAAKDFKGTGDAAYDTKKVNEFLTKFKPTYVNAEPLLTEALSRAKKEQKTLFLWFSAPW